MTESTLTMVPGPEGMAPLFAAKAAARLEFLPIVKNRTVQVRSDKGNYSFDYATLDSVRDSCDGALAKHGLDVMHAVCSAPEGRRELHTLLTHKSGCYIEQVVAIPDNLKMQDLGSALTYLERYCYVAMIGVASEHDDDGNAADGNKVQDSKPSPQRTPPAPQEAPPVKPAMTQDNIPKRPAGPPPLPVTPPEPKEEEEPAGGIEPLKLTTDTRGAIGKAFATLGYNRMRAMGYVKAICGKASEELTEEDGQKLLQALQDGVVP